MIAESIQLRSKQRGRGALWLSALLVFGIFVEVNRVVDHWDLPRRDLSEDGLFQVSSATKSVLGRLEDTLAVHGFFTKEIESGRAAIERAQVEGQLEEYLALAGGKMVLDVRDPAVSSQAALDAKTHGLQARPVQAAHGTSVSRQMVYRSLLLRYRGRTERVEWADPWSLEVDFVAAVARMLRDHRPRIAWVGETFDTDPKMSWQLGSNHSLRQALSRRFDLVQVSTASLEAGEPVPPGCDLVVLMRPTKLHPRAVFELEQSLQRGKPMLAFLDQVSMHSHSQGSRAVHAMRGEKASPTGLEALLRSWGTSLIGGHVWDAGASGVRQVLVSQLDAQGQPTGAGRLEPLTSPGLLETTAEGMDGTFPPTSGLSGITLGWAQPFAPLQGVSGIVGRDVIHSSEDSWVVPFVETMVSDQAIIAGHTATLRSDPKASQVVGRVLTGRLPSPFVGGAPVPLDLFDEEATDPAGGEPKTTDETVLDRAADVRVVLLGDADFVRDPDPYGLCPSLKPRGLLLVENLLDWMLAEEDLIALRSRLPQSRPLRDLLQEELEREGLLSAGLYDTVEELTLRARQKSAAEGRATRARWRLMGLPVGLGLLLMLLCGWAWNRRERSHP